MDRIPKLLHKCIVNGSKHDNGEGYIYFYKYTFICIYTNNESGRERGCNALSQEDLFLVHPPRFGWNTRSQLWKPAAASSLLKHALAAANFAAAVALI